MPALAALIVLPAEAAEFRYCYERPAPDFTVKETKADRMRINEVLMGRLPVAMMERQCGIERPETRNAMNTAIVEAGCSAESDIAKSVNQMMTMPVDEIGGDDMAPIRAAHPAEYQTFCDKLSKIDFTKSADPEFMLAMDYFVKSIAPLMARTKE